MIQGLAEAESDLADRSLAKRSGVARKVKNPQRNTVRTQPLIHNPLMVVSQQMITKEWSLYTLFGEKNTTPQQTFLIAGTSRVDYRVSIEE